MTVAEFVGFLIMVAALLFSLASQIFGQKKPQTKEEKEEYERAMREFLASLEPEKKPSAAPPPLPKRKQERVRAEVTREFEFHGRLDEFATHTNIEDRHIDVTVGQTKLGKLEDRKKDASYKLREKAEHSYLHDLLQDPQTRRNMILLNEVLQPPLSIRDEL